MKTLKELMAECAELYHPKDRSDLELVRHSDGTWSASIGLLNAAVSVGECSEFDTKTYHAEPEDAIIELIEIVKDIDSIRAQRKQEREELRTRLEESPLGKIRISATEISSQSIRASKIELAKKD